MKEGSGFCHIFFISQFNNQLKNTKQTMLPRKRGKDFSIQTNQNKIFSLSDKFGGYLIFLSLVIIQQSIFLSELFVTTVLSDLS